MARSSDYIQGLKIGEHGYAFLVTQSGLYAASPDADANMKKKITESPDPKRQELGNKIMGLTEPAHFMTDAFGEDAYVVALPIAATGLHLVLVAPTADYSGPIHTAIATNVARSTSSSSAASSGPSSTSSRARRKSQTATSRPSSRSRT